MSLADQVVESFHSAAGAVARGMIVRATAGVRQTLLAQADTLGNLASIIGVANNATGAGGIYNAVTAGTAECLLETGLTPAGGQIVYVSASVAGRGTTVTPAKAISIGTIINASLYSLNGRVTVKLFALFSASADADWDITKMRMFLLDNDAGDDANVGYVDITPGDVIAPAGKAIKTITRYLQLLPRVGAGRLTGLLMKPRSDFGAYLSPLATPEALDYRGFSGYARILRRGSTDLTNSVADKITCGFQQAQVGPDAGGAWTVIAGATVSVFSITGALSAEPALIGRRVRFEGNVNPALANVCRNISANTGTAITVGFDLPAVPGVGERVFIETCGVAVLSYNEADNGGGSEILDPVTFGLKYPLVLAGIAITSSTTASTTPGSLTSTQYSGFEDRSISTFAIPILGFGRTKVISLEPSYVDEVGVAREIGFGFRTGSAAQWSGYFVAARAVAYANSGSLHSPIFQAAGFDVGGQGSYFGTGAILSTLGGSSAPLTVTGSAFVDNNFTRQFFGRKGSTERKTRMKGFSNDIVDTAQLYLVGVNVKLNGVTSDTAGGAPAIKALGGGLVVVIDDYDGSTGNTNVGLDLTDADDAVVEIGLGVAVTVTGTAGDIRLANGTIIPWATLAGGEVSDARGNRLRGTGGVQFTKITNGVIGNIPILAADPAVVIDGDFWFKDTGGVQTLNVRIAGTTRFVVLI